MPYILYTKNTFSMVDAVPIIETAVSIICLRCFVKSKYLNVPFIRYKCDSQWSFLYALVQKVIVEHDFIILQTFFSVIFSDQHGPNRVQNINWCVGAQGSSSNLSATSMTSMFNMVNIVKDDVMIVNGLSGQLFLCFLYIQIHVPGSRVYSLNL